MKNIELASRLDWSRLLGFHDVADAPGSAGKADRKVGTKVGSKPGVKVGAKAGLKN